MLSSLQIRNLAIVEHLDLELQAGLTVVTGETGAGKSIVVDALGFGLGERADAGLVRPGRDRAEVSLSYDLARCPGAAAWLRENDLDTDDECIIRRTLSREGRSRGYINGRPVTMQLLRALGDLLVDIHGQHAHQSLLHGAQQRALLDQYGDYTKQLDATAQAFRRWKTIEREIKTLDAQTRDRAARLDLLRYQVPELDEAAPQADELPALEAEQRRLAHAAQILAVTQNAVLDLYEDDEQAVSSRIGRTRGEIGELADYDARLAEAGELLGNALIQIEESVQSLRSAIDGMHPDPQRLDEIEQRLDLLQSLARKHQVEPEALHDTWQTLSGELAGLEDSDQQGDLLHAQLEDAQTAYRKAAASLTRQRRKAAKALQQKIAEVIQTLGMPQATFEISVKTSETGAGETGADSVEFLVSANPGQPPGAMARIASGGELSRIGLAIHLITAREGRIPTLIFDEADVGVGGGVAEVVGQTLRTLGEARQVLCVTHLPQVAAQGHHHLKVSKSQSAESTVTSVDLLAESLRVDELARMLGGVRITDKTLAHAREMLNADPA